MPDVLVTGGSGFIGKRLVAHLVERGDAVRCLVRAASKTAPLEALGVELARGDLNDTDSLRAAVEGVRVVYHLAGVTKAIHKQHFLTANESGIEHLIAACSQCDPPPVLVVVSSISAAGPAPDDRPGRESDPPHPVSNYGCSKRAGEAAAQRHAGELPITVVRPAIVFGPGDRDCLGWFKSVRTGLHVVPSLRNRRVSMIHVDDLCTAIAAAAERGQRLVSADDPAASEMPGCYFLAAEPQPTYADLGRLVAASLGRKVFVVHVPQLFGWITGAVNELISRLRGRAGIVSLDKIREATAGDWHFCTERAQRDLGFAPARTLPERLRETADWYRSEGWL